MGAHRIAVDMMDKASALPTYPQRQQQKQPTDFTIGLKASTRLHDEGEKKGSQAVAASVQNRGSEIATNDAQDTLMYVSLGADL
jgi:hypothetical protein